MSVAHYCDRCGAEVWNNWTTTAQALSRGQVIDEEGRGVWELCEGCTLELRDWINEMAEVKAERQSNR